jgi:cation diffusion facilitator family transporter
MSAIAAGRRKLAHIDIASRAAFLSLSSNAVLMVVKLTIGVAFGSIAVLGDGIDSAEDVLASGLAFLSVRLALQPADESHPYGHGKAESLAAMSQATLIAGGAVFIAVTAVRRLVTHDVEIHVVPSLAAMGAAVAVNLAVAAYSFRAARISGSVAIAADARHLLTNVVQAVAVVAGLALVGATGSHFWDPAVALALAAYLLWIAMSIARSALRELVDTSLPAETMAALQSCLARESHEFRGFHQLRTRKSGRETYIDLHVLVDPAITVHDAHQLIEELERDVRAVIPGAVLMAHIDPDEPARIAGEDASARRG